MEDRTGPARRVHGVEVREPGSRLRSGETVAGGRGDEVLTSHVTGLSGGETGDRSAGRVWQRDLRAGRPIPQTQELLDGERVPRSVRKERTVHVDAEDEKRVSLGGKCGRNVWLYRCCSCSRRLCRRVINQ